MNTNIKKSLFASLLFFISSLLSAQTNYLKDSLIADFREYVSFLEETHTDPYSAFGGKMRMHREVQRVLSGIPEEGLSSAEFSSLLSAFCASLHDGHTFVIDAQNLDLAADKIVNLKFKILSDALAIVQSPQGKLNGSKIISINDVPVDTLLVRVQSVKPCENRAGVLFSLTQALMRKSSAERLLGNLHEDKIKLNLLNVHEQPAIEYAAYVDAEQRDIKPNASPLRVSMPKTVPFEYRYVDDRKKTVWLAYNTTFAREVVELQKQWGQDYNTSLNLLYTLFNLGEAPSDYSEAIQKIPSLAEMFSALLEDMKKNQSTHLIIDLRENGGGWSPINTPTLYMLKGDAYFAYRCRAQYITRLSKPFLQKMNTTMEGYNTANRTNYVIGDYSYNWFYRQWEDSIPLQERRIKYLETNFDEHFTGTDLLKRIDGIPLYTPQIIVLTSAATFSAAFQYAFLLKEMCGATIIGAPSMQAFNSGMGTTFHTLTNTGVTVSVSNSFQLFDPDYTEPDNMLQPDFLLLWKDFLRYNSSEDAEIPYVMDLIDKGVV